MFVDYEKIGNIVGFCKDFFYQLKLKQNLNYINKNQKKVLKTKKNKTSLNVVFYVYDESKWKSQSVYNLMEKDCRFNPLIVVTKNCAVEGNANYQTVEDVEKCYEYFKSRGMNVEYGYDTKKNNFIPFEVFEPDIIIYSHPWYVYKTQGPVVCSKFALTYYIPYFIPASEQWHEYGLRFHQYLYKHYVSTDLIKNFYSKNMSFNSKSLRVVGHPVFDEYLNSNDNEFSSKYIIYAPHWTVCGDNLRFGTFDWSGEKILEFAQNHKELNWIFRPHPLLYKFILTSGFMTKEKIDNYYNEWKSFALYSEGEYTNLFNQSYAMITDCGSFLTEYFITGNPVIHLVSDKFIPNKTVEMIDKTYYTVHNPEELEQYLKDIILDKNDYKKDARKELLETLNLKNGSSAERIINDILTDFNA